jgi:hypothetical protein
MASILCTACVHEALAGRILVLFGLVNLSRSKVLSDSAWHDVAMRGLHVVVPCISFQEAYKAVA